MDMGVVLDGKVIYNNLLAYSGLLMAYSWLKKTINCRAINILILWRIAYAGDDGGGRSLSGENDLIDSIYCGDGPAG